MNKTTLFALALLSVIAFGRTLQAQSVRPDDVTGVWFNEEKDAKIQISRGGSRFSGKIVWMKDPLDPATHKPKLDEKNPDPALKHREKMGLVILKNFVFEDGEWVGGDIYDPKSGKTYHCKMKLNGMNILDVRGYIGYSWMGLGRTAVWTRTKL